MLSIKDLSTSYDDVYFVSKNAGNVDKGYDKEITKRIFRYTRRELFDCLRRVHTPAACGGTKGMYPESNTLPKQPYPDRSAAGLVDYIVRFLPPDTLFIPKDFCELKTLMNQDKLKNKVVLINVQTFVIPKDSFFDILLSSDFFIHMPGETQPYCHNQIESMLAGCIPVTHLAKYFIPNFRHEFDSLLFETPDNLIHLLNDISGGLYDSSIAQMRVNILNYYRENYSHSSLKNKIDTLISKGKQYTNYYIHSGDINILKKLHDV